MTIARVIYVGIRRTQGRGARADRTVNVEVAGETADPMPFGELASLCLIRDKLGPVADDLGPVTAITGSKDIGKVLRGREVRPGILVHQPDADGRRSFHGGVDVGTPVGRADAVAERVAGSVVGLARHQTTVIPARQVASTGRGSQSRRDDG